MIDHVKQLLVAAGPPLSESSPRLSAASSSLAGELTKQLLQLLWMRNGFIAYEGALEVFPTRDESDPQLDVNRWNSPSEWRSAYAELAAGCLFFAQDVLGAQFCIYAGAVHRFDPETGDKEYFATSINEWAMQMCAEPEVNTGYPLLQQWERAYGKLAFGTRLVPKIPFVLGGEYQVQNLHPMDAGEAMRFYGDLAVQLHRMPDGAQVQLKAVD